MSNTELTGGSCGHQSPHYTADGRKPRAPGDPPPSVFPLAPLPPSIDLNPAPCKEQSSVIDIFGEEIVWSRMYACKAGLTLCADNLFYFAMMCRISAVPESKWFGSSEMQHWLRQQEKRRWKISVPHKETWRPTAATRCSASP